MTRNTTTRDFRERAVAMVIAGKSEQQVADELKIDVQKVRRWYKNALSDRNSITELFEHKNNHSIQSEPEQVTENIYESVTTSECDPEKRRLQQENKCLKELVSISARWISTYISMQSNADSPLG